MKLRPLNIKHRDLLSIEVAGTPRDYPIFKFMVGRISENWSRATNERWIENFCRSIQRAHDP